MHVDPGARANTLTTGKQIREKQDNTQVFDVKFRPSETVLIVWITMRPLKNLGQKALEKLIAKNVPRDVFMALEDAAVDGDSKGRAQAALFARGHKRTAAGHLKHLHSNETFHEALRAHGANPSPLRGTSLVVGRLGVFNVARLNVPGHKWTKLRRSSNRAKLALLNGHIQRKYVQSDLFAEQPNVAEATLFFLSVMDGEDENGLSQLTQCMVALPAPDLNSWLYLKPLKEFMKVYDRAPGGLQVDKVVPRLKGAQQKKNTGTEDDNGNS